MFFTFSDFNVASTRVDVEISFSDKYRTEWRKLSNSQIESMLKKISDEVIYDYYYDDYYDRYKDVRIDIYMGGSHQGYYYRDYDSSYGTFYER